MTEESGVEVWVEVGDVVSSQNSLLVHRTNYTATAGHHQPTNTSKYFYQKPGSQRSYYVNVDMVFGDILYLCQYFCANIFIINLMGNGASKNDDWLWWRIHNISTHDCVMSWFHSVWSVIVTERFSISEHSHPGELFVPVELPTKAVQDAVLVPTLLPRLVLQLQSDPATKLVPPAVILLDITPTYYYLPVKWDNMENSNIFS